MRKALPPLLATLVGAAALPPATPAQGAAFGSVLPPRPVHTYSIVACDPQTGELGVAVQSHWFSVGPIVPWAEAGVGAVATQSFVEPSYGPLGLELMRAGKTGPEALRALLAGDANTAVRQVAMIDARCNVDAWTGGQAIQAAGHRVGRNYSVQANLMRGNVWDPMAAAFERARGDLAERLLAALEAAERAGGDIRGKQSAALIVVSGKPTGRPWADRLFDLRVEDDPDPVTELRRLVHLGRAYRHMNAGDEAVTRGDVAAAIREYAAAEAMVPDSATNGEMVFWHAVMLVNAGRIEESLPLFRRAFAQDEGWRELVRRLPAAGQLPKDPVVVERIVAVR
ncbi:MAG TPA: DUF1028 domain-containing protein [Longimicrobiaceae bacterium]|nr:DUF1028 domain-containing protein [Longimicrobiaceae bacterium]